MANGWSIVIGLIIVVLASAAAWFLSPKGETQTYVSVYPCIRGAPIFRADSTAGCMARLPGHFGLTCCDYVLGTMASTHRTQKGRFATRVCETYELSGR
ncbi:hypothetical protein DSL72_002156 [Monilinia vaccinii-corymbosi]|uniref:Uncharacterized protein n=1 Tax=Monilinia vaccinii-corymbosi TaxID=61207 RepID=A0A8A3PBY3_9HELO|nr:hypothetical protein DSL72_002156 [Monilinia vaccinii-corymbosi]